MKGFPMRSKEFTVAYFVSPHGFGHAARAAAVMSAVHEMCPSIDFEIFTEVPIWFFEDSLAGPFSYHSLKTDVGLVQRTPFEEDLRETLKVLDRFFPFKRSFMADLGEKLTRLSCKLVVCDIAPMGIEVAREAGISSVLVENFTWDWIYARYTDFPGDAKRHVPYLQRLFDAATYHVQCAPVCCPRKVDLSTGPVSRSPKIPAPQIRKQLGLSEQARVVMVTTGGVVGQYPFLETLKQQPAIHFIIPGGSHIQETRENLILLPHRSDFFHPDLINASDAVIGKIGYSTLAEVYHAGVPFGYVNRPSFPETEILAAYAKAHMKGFKIEQAEFEDARWIWYPKKLLSLPRIHRDYSNGAVDIARFILSILGVET
jgi:hypothetical protein